MVVMKEEVLEESTQVRSLLYPWGRGKTDLAKFMNAGRVPYRPAPCIHPVSCFSLVVLCGQPQGYFQRSHDVKTRK